MTEISTDVDHLIRTIADRKKIPLNELKDICNIDKKNLDKWVTVLEDEGYIEVEYGIRGTFIIWKGESEEEEIEPHYETYEEVPYEEPKKSVEFSNEVPLEEDQEFPKQEEPVGPEVEAEEEIPEDNLFALPDADIPDDDKDDDVKEESAMTDVPEEPEEAEAPEEPEELLNRYLEKKRSSDDVKSKILGKFEDEYSPKNPPTLPEEDESIDQDHEPVDLVEDEPVHMEPEEKPRRSLRNSDMQRLVSSYMDEINREKKQIAQLTKDKENLMDEDLAQIEGKLQADIVAITEKIIQRQKRITELKEHVLELPDKIDEVEKIQDRLDELKDETGQALTRTRDKAETFLANIERSKGDVHEKISQLKTLIEDQSSKVEDLESTSLALEDQSAKITETLDEARRQMNDLNSTIKDLSKDLDQVQEKRSEIEELKESVKDTVASHGEELDSLEEELEGIEKVEQWVSEYINDYESKIVDIENYVEESDADIAELKESAESLYLQKYIAELEKLSAQHEKGLDDAAEREKDIDLRIAESKERIAALLKESKEMMRKLQDGSGDDYDRVLSKVKSRMSKAKEVVEEKTSQRKASKAKPRKKQRKKPGKKK